MPGPWEERRGGRRGCQRCSDDGRLGALHCLREARFAGTADPIRQHDEPDVRIRCDERGDREIPDVQIEATDDGEERPVDRALPGGGPIGGKHEQNRQEDQENRRPRLLAVEDGERQNGHQEAAENARQPAEQGRRECIRRDGAEGAHDRVRKTDREFVRPEAAEDPRQEEVQRRMVGPGRCIGQRRTDGRLADGVCRDDLVEP